MNLFKNNAFTTDAWRALGADEDVPHTGHVILTLAQWQAKRDALVGSNLPLGIQLEPGTPVSAIAADLKRFALIAMNFPKFGDGRGFSIGQQLREAGFDGELRAVGEVLFDQLQYMARCGFDAFDITDANTHKLVASGQFNTMDLFYQPAITASVPVGTRPWARKAG